MIDKSAWELVTWEHNLSYHFLIRSFDEQRASQMVVACPQSTHVVGLTLQLLPPAPQHPMLPGFVPVGIYMTHVG
jgi:hypothetical protein